MGKVASSAVLFSELFELYSNLRSSYVAESTIDETFVPAKKPVLRTVGDKPARTITSLELLSMGQTELKRQRKPGGINANIRVLRGFGNWAAKQELLPAENPFATLELLKTETPEPRFLTHEEFRLIYNAESRLHLRDIYLFLLLSGQRAGDVLRLSWENVDLGRAVMRFRIGKTKRLHQVPLHPELLSLLQRMVPKSAGNIWGREYTVRYVSHRFKAAARKVKVTDVSLHKLRATFASHLALSGVDLYQISKLIGHASVLTTQKYYASLITSELHGVVARLQPVTGCVALYTGGQAPNPWGGAR